MQMPSEQHTLAAQSPEMGPLPVRYGSLSPTFDWVALGRSCSQSMRGVFNDLKTRDCQDIVIAIVDRLKGLLADALTTVYPRATVQTCIVHLLRNNLDYAGWKERKPVVHALRPICTTNAIESLNIQPR